MYEYLKGKFTQKSATQVVVECGGVGYDVNISLNTFSKIKEAAEGIIYTHLAVREDAHVLYGFADEDERRMFRLLITVSGIGSNTARVMLSALNAQELQQAIATGNAPLLQKIKGIGSKTAQRVIIDLKDKLLKEPVSESTVIMSSHNTLKNEALSALSVLGFARASAEKAIETVLTKNNFQKVEDVIKSALAIL